MKKKQWEPVTGCAFSKVTADRDNSVLVIDPWTSGYPMSNHRLPVRILREKDYQRLLKLARKERKP